MQFLDSGERFRVDEICSGCSCSFVITRLEDGLVLLLKGEDAAFFWDEWCYMIEDQYEWPEDAYDVDTLCQLFVDHTCDPTLSWLSRGRPGWSRRQAA